MYIALQFYGLIRGFRFETTRNLFYERIIKQLENQGYEVHIFWHTYDIMEAREGTTYGCKNDCYEFTTVSDNLAIFNFIKPVC